MNSNSPLDFYQTNSRTVGTKNNTKKLFLSTDQHHPLHKNKNKSPTTRTPTITRETRKQFSNNPTYKQNQTDKYKEVGHGKQSDLKLKKINLNDQIIAIINKYSILQKKFLKKYLN